MGHKVNIIERGRTYEGVAVLVMLVSVMVSLLYAYQIHRMYIESCSL